MDGSCHACLATCAEPQAGAAIDWGAQTIDCLLEARHLGIASRSTSSPGETLGRYAVTGHLGQGGMGQVLQVHDGNLGREMAAKVIRGQADPQALDKFIREAQITGQLEHPNIVPTHELGLTPDGRVYFTMKRVEGQNLEELLGTGGEDEEMGLFECLKILLKVCDALSFAHAKGVIHRDLKPSNIMVGQFGEVLVVDWGLARVIGEPDQAEAGCTLDLSRGPLANAARPGEAAPPLRTLDGTVVGTPHFMPPEQARGEVGRVDRRSDVYALGAILYQMLTRELPYQGSSSWEVLAQVIEGAPPPPSACTPEREIAWELESVVCKAMAHRPRDRYDTVAAMQQDLESYLGGRLLGAAEYSAWQVLKKWAVRHKPAVGAALGVLLTILSALVAIGAQLRRANQASQEAQSEKRTAQASERKARALLEENRRARLRDSATQRVQRAMELYTRGGDAGEIRKLLAQVEGPFPDHQGLLRLRGRMALDREAWPSAKALLERALARTEDDYLTHYLLYRWYAEQGRGNGSAATRHLEAVARYATTDTAIGLWARGRREWDGADALVGGAKRQALGRAIELCTAALKKQPDFYRALIGRGSCHWKLAAWDAALADYNRAVELRGRPLCYVNRAVLYATMGQHDQALADIDRAIELAPEFPLAYFNRGILHRQLKRYDKALADYNKALALDPDGALIYDCRARLHEAMDQPGRALADYGKAIALAPRMVQSYRHRGRLQQKMKRHAQALSDFSAAIRLTPRHPEAYLDRGELYRAMKRNDRAIADYDRAIGIDPGLARAYYARGYVQWTMKRPEQALADCSTAIRLNLGEADCYYLRARIHHASERHDKALADYDAAIRIDPDHALAYFNRAEVHHAMKRLGQALADYDRAIRIDPRYAKAYGNRAALHYSMKQHGKARSDVEAALRLAPEHSATYLHLLGRIQHAAGRYDQALVAYGQALRIDPGFAKCYLSRGNTYQQTSQLDQALADFGSALRIDPRLVDAYVNRGVLHYHAKRYRRAIADWERALPLMADKASRQGLAKYIRQARSRLE